MERLLSPAALTFLCKLIAGGAEDQEGNPLGLRYGYHSSIEDLFGGANIEIVPRGSQGITPRTRNTLNQANSRPPDYSNLKKLIEEVVDPRAYPYRNDPDLNTRTVSHLNEVLRPDGFELRMVNQRWRLLPASSSQVVTEQLEVLVVALDFGSVKSDFDRALSQAEEDPEDAATSACSLVESVCKCILDEMEQPYPPKQDIKALVAEVGRHLNLSPARQDLPAELISDVKQILSGLISVTSGIGALRTHGGDAHGRGRKKAPVDARIARLAIHAASTVSLFYIETWNRTKSGGQ